MDWSLLSPYEVVGSSDGLSYFFITDSGHHYHAYFLEMKYYIPSFQNVYAFNLEPEEETPHPIDLRIAITVATLIRKFFNLVNNGIIYICDTTDGKGKLRKLLFDKWFRLFNNGRAVKYDAEAQTPDYCVNASLILLASNTDHDRIVSDFYRLVANGMMPENQV